MAEPLTAGMSNEIAWRMGSALNKALSEPAGDYTDRGLILLRMLNEHGFDVTIREAGDNG